MLCFSLLFVFLFLFCVEWMVCGFSVRHAARAPSPCICASLCGAVGVEWFCVSVVVV